MLSSGTIASMSSIVVLHTNVVTGLSAVFLQHPYAHKVVLHCNGKQPKQSKQRDQQVLVEKSY